MVTYLSYNVIVTMVTYLSYNVLNTMVTYLSYNVIVTMVTYLSYNVLVTMVTYLSYNVLPLLLTLGEVWLGTGFISIVADLVEPSWYMMLLLWFLMESRKRNACWLKQGANFSKRRDNVHFLEGFQRRFKKM